jgi:hypothetical protein
MFMIRSIVGQFSFAVGRSTTTALASSFATTTAKPRTAFAAHTFNETFRLLASHPRLVAPLRQLFGEDVYVHQFKLNAKAALLL